MAWEQKLNTSHDPVTFTTLARDPPKDHSTYKMAISRQLQEPVLKKRARQLIGLDSY
jgi:hypothetical protein